MSMPEWIRQALNRDGFSFVMFRYDQVPVAELTSGQLDALGATRTWQEQLYRDTLCAPAVAVQKLHHRTPSGEPDAVSFEYQASGYAIRTYALMNRMAMVLTPDSDTRQALGIGRVPIEAVASEIARSIIIYPGEVRLVLETQQSDGVYGRQSPEPSKKDEETGPLDLLHWWYADGVFGFVTWLVTPVIDGHYPSTGAVTQQQVYLWFDTFGMRRTLHSH
jgi:hypothetical protein